MNRFLYMFFFNIHSCKILTWNFTLLVLVLPSFLVTVQQPPPNVNRGVLFAFYCSGSAGCRRWLKTAQHKHLNKMFSIVFCHVRVAWYTFEENFTSGPRVWPFQINIKCYMILQHQYRQTFWEWSLLFTLVLVKKLKQLSKALMSTSQSNALHSKS